jgi:hypothetical protein
MYINVAFICRSLYRDLDMLRDRVRKDRWFRWWWRKPRSESEHIEAKFAPQLKINRYEGGKSLDLLLVNEARMTVWVEEVKVVLTNLDASWQTSIPTGQAKHEIRQNVRAKESLELSPAADIYEAAGRPQGTYSCLIYSDVRYRVGDEWFNKNLDTYSVEMTALKGLCLRRLRWYEKKALPRNRPA